MTRDLRGHRDPTAAPKRRVAPQLLQTPRRLPTESADPSLTKARDISAQLHAAGGAVIRGSLSSVVEHRGLAAEPVARLFAFVRATSSSGALLDLSSSLRHLTYRRVRLLRPALHEAAELPSRAPTYELVALVVESSMRHNATVGADVRGCEGSWGPTLGGQFSPRPPHDPDTCLRGRRPVARVSANGN